MYCTLNIKENIHIFLCFNLKTIKGGTSRQLYRLSALITMKFSDFSDSFTELVVCQTIIYFSESDIYSFRPISEQVILDPNILYVGFLEDFLKKSQKLPKNNLCLLHNLNDAKYLQEYVKGSEANIIYLIWHKKLCEMLDVVSSLFLSESHYTSRINRLMAASNTGRGLQYLLDEFFRLTGRPIIVIDTSYRILAMQGYDVTEDGLNLKEQKEYGYLTERNLERMKRDKIYEQLRQAPGNIHYGTPTDSLYGFLDALIYVHGIEMAEIGVMEYGRKFERYDFELINFMKQLVSWEMSKDNFIISNRGLMHSIFLAELLNQRFTNQNDIERRRRMLNWKLCEYLWIFTVFSNDQKIFRQKAEFLSIRLKNLLPDSRWVISDNNLIFLIMKDNNNTNEFLLEGVLSEILIRNHMYGVLSNPFSNLSDVKKYYMQTLAVQEFAERDKEKKPIIFYENYSILHIAKILSETNDLTEFYHPAVLAIKNYDSKNHTSYLNTLQEYLIHIDNPTESSKNLCIHKNTFFYRINKLKEHFNLNLNDGYERLKLHLTLEFLKYKF